MEPPESSFCVTRMVGATTPPSVFWRGMYSSPILAWASALSTGFGSAGTADEPITSPLAVSATGVSAIIIPVTWVSASRVRAPVPENTALALESTWPILSGPTAKAVTSVVASDVTASEALLVDAVERARPTAAWSLDASPTLADAVDAASLLSALIEYGPLPASALGATG